MINLPKLYTYKAFGLNIVSEMKLPELYIGEQNYNQVDILIKNVLDDFWFEHSF